MFTRQWKENTYFNWCFSGNKNCGFKHETSIIPKGLGYSVCSTAIEKKKHEEKQKLSKLTATLYYYLPSTLLLVKKEERTMIRLELWRRNRWIMYINWKTNNWHFSHWIYWTFVFPMTQKKWEMMVYNFFQVIIHNIFVKLAAFS